MEIALAVALVALLALFVLAPLRRREQEGGQHSEDPVVADLEARKEAKYREIRDAELDREEGKLSQADWARLDAELRRDAVEILKALDEVAAKAPAERREED